MTDKKQIASNRVDDILRTIESLANLANEISKEAGLDWNEEYGFSINKSSGTTEISWYRSSENC